MKRKLLLTLIVAILFTVGCSKKAQYSPEADYINLGYSGNGNERSARSSTYSGGFLDIGDAYTPMPASIEGQEPAEDTNSTAGNYSDKERKLVKTASVSIRVDNLETADASIALLLKKFDAYAATTSVEENSRGYSLRVPASYYEIFLEEMNGMGRLVSRYESTEDVTLRYYDLEGRLATKKELLKTFQSYLGRAKNIEEILSVEKYISELQNEIEGTGKQLRNLANRVDYATIDLRLMGPVTSAQTRGLTFGERVKQLFGGFGGFLSGFAMVIIGIVIYGIPITLLICLLFLLLFGKIGLLKKLWRLIKS